MSLCVCVYVWVFECVGGCFYLDVYINVEYSSTQQKSPTLPSFLTPLSSPSSPSLPAELTERMSLDSIKEHNWHIQSCCALTGEGLFEGLDWLVKNFEDVQS